ncbi:MAG: CoA pyrophosphatase [Pseudomonadota bacterium]
MHEASPIFERIRLALERPEQPWLGRAGERREAAVLVALTNEVEPRVILGRRARHLPLHPGEISFPGGKRELEDFNPWVTATREAEEEMGISEHELMRLGTLEPLVTRTQFEVHTRIAAVHAGVNLVIDPGEFDGALLLSLKRLANPDSYDLKRMSDGKTHRMVPHYYIAEETIWGVTAAILAQLANLAYDAGLKLE